MFPRDSSEGRQQKDTVKDEAKLPAGYPEKLRQAAGAIYHSDRCQEGFSTPSPRSYKERGQEANLNYCQEGTPEEIALGFPVHGAWETWDLGKCLGSGCWGRATLAKWGLAPP